VRGIGTEERQPRERPGLWIAHRRRSSSPVLKLAMLEVVAKDGYGGSSLAFERGRTQTKGLLTLLPAPPIHMGS